jgi:hypothetical protein
VNASLTKKVKNTPLVLYKIVGLERISKLEEPLVKHAELELIAHLLLKLLTHHVFQVS